MFKLVVVLFVVLLTATVTASLEEASENSKIEVSKEDLEKMLSYLLHPRAHNHKHKRRCGVSGLRKLEAVCPDFCSVEGNQIVHDMCSMKLSDEDIKMRCCPDTLE
ncbi:hypothetical protein B9Z55_008161 [Caenorhabditis nigoni]|uniref:INSulin related n=2 Tax=Caenorhabditis nigoni TaxID=1611254 RepID=A0A2G5VCZ0_9PELO|nr:hypothetical protein B9Z55_008161 [Caenorhabditis nigoni]